MKRLLSTAIAGLAVVATLSQSAAAQTVSLGPAVGGCCDFGWRGYAFQAQQNMRITSLTHTGASTNGEFRILSFTALPPAFPSATGVLTQLFYGTGNTTATNVNVTAGTWIGIVAYDLTNAQTNYSAFSTGHTVSIFGNAVELTRIGQQALGAPTDVFSENGTLAAIDFTYDTGSVVPEPSTYALMGAGLLGMLVVARRRKA